MAATNPENFGIALDDIIRKKKKEEKQQAKAVLSSSTESQEDWKNLYREAHWKDSEREDCRAPQIGADHRQRRQSHDPQQQKKTQGLEPAVQGQQPGNLRFVQPVRASHNL